MRVVNDGTPDTFVTIRNYATQEDARQWLASFDKACTVDDDPTVAVTVL